VKRLGQFSTEKNKRKTTGYKETWTEIL